MKSLRIVVGIIGVLLAGRAFALAQTPPATVDGLVSAAKAAAGVDWAGTFLRLCIPPPPAAPVPAGGAAAAPAPAAATRTPAREIWYAEPARVADNLYFIGTKVITPGQSSEATALS
jgi:hypothetical protein